MVSVEEHGEEACLDQHLRRVREYNRLQHNALQQDYLQDNHLEPEGSGSAHYPRWEVEGRCTRSEGKADKWPRTTRVRPVQQRLEREKQPKKGISTGMKHKDCLVIFRGAHIGPSSQEKGIWPCVRETLLSPPDRDTRLEDKGKRGRAHPASFMRPSETRGSRMLDYHSIRTHPSPALRASKHAH